MIYSAWHRQSIFESFLGLLPSIGILVVGFWVGINSWFIPLGVNLFEALLWVAASLVVGTVIHELAHLLVGLLGGRQIRKILIGEGRTVFTARLHGLRIQVCSNLLGGGAVMFSANDDPAPGTMLAAIAAGPGVNVVIGLWATAVMATSPPWVGTFALTNLVLGILNFVPSRVTTRDQNVVTDGMQMLRILQGRPLRGTFFEGEELAADARHAAILAIEEARDAGSGEVNEVHLLAALRRDPQLRGLLATAHLDDLFRWPGPGDASEVRPERTPAFDAIEKRAFHVGRDLQISLPNAACLLLALMAEPCDAATRLKEAGISEEAVRQIARSQTEQASEYGGGPVSPDVPLERWGSSADRALDMAFRIAAVERAEDTGTQHLVAALAADLDGRAGRALWQLGFALTRNEKLIPKKDPPATPPALSPQAQAAIAGALLRTGPTFPTGTGELCLGVCDQGRGMGGFLFVQADVTPDSLVAALRGLPREQSDPVGFTPSMRRMWELRASARLGAGRYADALADFRVLEKDSTTEERLAISRNNVAYTALLTGDPALRGEALEKSRLAVDFKPDQRSFQGTYAFALLENGSPSDAAAILEKVVVEHPRPRDRALDLCLLAVCRARLGQLDDAKRRIAEADQADSRCMLLARARDELERSTAGLLSST